MKIDKVETNAKAGTATITVTVNTAGTVTLSGDKVAMATHQVRKGSTFTTTGTVAPAYRQTLIKSGELAVDLAITFDEATGQSASRSVNVALIKKG
ncbi:hypothetical protein [Streptomyces sp. NPDC002619]|uniref:hypothetical protein n=1 Tax=Streptomyces sp. NPDC002619 TaxID=3364655 RepID=UPI0036A226A4